MGQDKEWEEFDGNATIGMKLHKMLKKSAYNLRYNKNAKG